MRSLSISRSAVEQIDKLTGYVPSFFPYHREPAPGEMVGRTDDEGQIDRQRTRGDVYNDAERVSDL
jgi:hypothetical protein